MYKQSDAAIVAWRATERTLDGKVTITDSNGNETNYGTSDITSIAYDSGAWTGDTFSIGSTYENNITVTFAHLVEGLKQGYKVTAKIGIKLPDGTYEYCPLGVFIISDEITMDRNNDATTIKAYDQFCTMQGTYTSKLTYPAKITDVIAEIANMSGVELNTDDIAELPTQTDLASAISGQTYCTAIGWIAQFYGGFATFDRDGKLTIRTVTDASYVLDASQYEQSGLTKNEATYQIGGMSVSVTTTTTDSTGESSETTSTLVAGETTGSQIELTNNVMTQARLDNIWTTIKDITFYPYSLTWFGNPAIEAGDWLTLKDTAGNSFNVPNNSYTMTFDGGLTATSKADQTSTSSSSYSYSGALSQTVKQLAGRIGATGNYIFGTDTTVEPTTAKIGDLWYKQNGNKIEMWQYVKQTDGTGKWELIVSDATGEEVKADVDKAMAEADTATKNANAAVETGNQALTKAQAGIDTANAAADNASTAMSNSSTAINNAKSAMTDASNAVDSANSAMTKATTALSTANSSSDIANAVQQQVTTLKDGSTMTIADLANGLALRLVKKDLDGYATQSWASDQITTTADAINVNLTKVQNQVNDSAVGVNLLTGTSNNFQTSSDNWIEQNTVKLSDIGLSVGDTVTFSAYLDLTNINSGGAASFYFATSSNNKLSTSDGNVVSAQSIGRSSSTAVIPNTAEYIVVEVWASSGFKYKEEKLERGSVATDWCLNPAEQATQSYVSTTLEATATSLTANLESYTDTKSTNALNSAKSYADSQIKATADGMQTQVTSIKKTADKATTDITTLNQRASGWDSTISSLKQTKADQNWTTNQIKASADSLNVNISKVQTQVNDSAVGTNLLIDTRDVSFTGNAGSNQVPHVWTFADTIQNIYASSPIVTLSYEWSVSGNSPSGTFSMQLAGTPWTGLSDSRSISSTNTSGTVVQTTTLSGITSSTAVTGIQIRMDKVPTGITLTISKLKLERGSVATDYSANPADNASVTSVTDLSITLDGIKQTVAKKVDNTTFASYQTQTATLIGSKVASTDFNSYKTQTDNALSQRVTSSTFSSYQTQTDSAIQQRVTSATYNAEITTLSNQINSKVSQEDFLNSAVGANLLTGTKAFSGNWNNIGNWDSSDNWVDPNGNTAFKRTSAWNGLSQPYVVSKGKTYTFSAYYDWTSGDSAYFYPNSNVSGAAQVAQSSVPDLLMSNAWELFTYTFTAAADGEFWGRFELTGDGVLHVGSYKLEHGSNATPWCPAASEIADYSQIQQLSDNINLRVVKNDVINQINISTESILIGGSKVHITGQTTIDNAVIKSAMVDTLSADKVTFGTLNAANVNVINLNADNISSGTLSGDYISGGTITGVSFHQTSSGMDTWIDGNGIHNYDGSNNSTWIKNGNLEIEGSNGNKILMGSALSNAAFASSGGEALIVSSIEGISYVSAYDSTYFNTPADATTYSSISFDNSIGLGMIISSKDSIHIDNTTTGSYISLDNNSVYFYDKTNTNTIGMSGSGISLSTKSGNTIYAGNDLHVNASLYVSGSKNAIVQTSAGWAKINAYETAEYYFGDMAKVNTGSGSKVKVEMDSLFLETVNTNLDYHVFLSSYGAGYAWISEQTSTYFVIESSTPNLEVSYEIKAKRKGYENTRLEIDEDFGKEAA
jgi:hypothetical protein